MTIATDTHGENIGFGATTPIITPDHTDAQVRDFCATIAEKLYSRPNETTDPANPDCFTLPLPIRHTGDASYYTMQETALRAALYMTRSLVTNGFTVMSCTPVAMATEDDEGTRIGFALLVTHTANIAPLMAAQDENPAAMLWTGYPRTVYGRAAINDALESMKAMIAGNDGNVH